MSNPAPQPHPENLKPFPPGVSGNPEGRKTAGATIREHINSLAEKGLTEAELLAVARDKNEPWTRRAAAERILKTLEVGDLADFQPLMHGMTLQQLRDQGVNTETLKKYRLGKDGVSFELHDRAGTDFDRVVEQTAGKPEQAVRHSGAVNMIVDEP